MSRANADECPHPTTRLQTVEADGVKLLGFYRCRRCGSEVDNGRTRELQISPRVRISVDQCVSISEPQGWPSYGRFKYAEAQESGRLVAAVLTVNGWRFVLTATPELDTPVKTQQRKSPCTVEAARGVDHRS